MYICFYIIIDLSCLLFHFYLSLSIARLKDLQRHQEAIQIYIDFLEVGKTFSINNCFYYAKKVDHMLPVYIWLLE